MPRVKRSVHARKKRRKVLGEAKGYWGRSTSPTARRRSSCSSPTSTPTATGATASGRSAGSGSSGSTPRRAQQGLSYNQFVAGLPQGRDRARPQGARRPRRPGPGRVREDRRSAPRPRSKPRLSGPAAARSLLSAARRGCVMFAAACPDRPPEAQREEAADADGVVAARGGDRLACSAGTASAGCMATVGLSPLPVGRLRARRGRRTSRSCSTGARRWPTRHRRSSSRTAATGEERTASRRRSSDPGERHAISPSVVFPTAGSWSVAVNDGFPEAECAQTHTFGTQSIAAVGPPSEPPAAAEPAAAASRRPPWSARRDDAGGSVALPLGLGLVSGSWPPSARSSPFGPGATEPPGSPELRSGRISGRPSRRRPEMITSASNPRLKLLRRLQTRRGRERLGLFVCEGEDLVEAALDAGLEPVEALLDASRPALSSGCPRPEPVEPKLLAGASELAHPPRAVAVFRRADLPRLDAGPVPPAGLALWRVGDPGNVGALIRSADALGPAFVCLSEGCADPHGPEGAARLHGRALPARRSGRFAEAPGPRIALVPDGATPLAERLARPPRDVRPRRRARRAARGRRRCVRRGGHDSAARRGRSR